LPSLNLLITSAVSTEERGMITSLYGAVRFFGVALGPPSFGYLVRFGRFTLFGAAAVLTLLTLGAVLLWLHPSAMLGGGRGENRLGGKPASPTLVKHSPGGP